MKKMLMALMFLALVGGVGARNEKKKHKAQQSTQQQMQQCAQFLSASAAKSYPSVDLSQVNTATAKWVITNAKNITSCQGQDFNNSVKLATQFLENNRQYFVSQQQSDQYAGSDDSGEPVY